MSYPVITNIHQILILEDGELPVHLPQEIQRSQDAIVALYPEAQYHLWGGKQLRELIKREMSIEVLRAFDSLKPMAYQADLGRYIVLYLLGGLYVDLGVVLQNHWTFPSYRKIAAFKDAAFVSPNWTAIQNGLLWAEPKRLEFLQAIGDICHHCQEKYYGHNPLYPTGPVLLGKAFVRIALTEQGNNTLSEQDIGQCICLTPEGTTNNLSYFSKSGNLVALRIKKVPGDLVHLGIKNGNNYNHLWNARCVYGEIKSHEIIQYWSAADQHIKPLGTANQNSNGICVSIPMKGRMNTGPYTTIPAGEYKLEIIFTEETKFFFITAEVAYGHKNKIFHKRNYFSWPRSKKTLFFPLTFRTYMEHVEFRIKINKSFSGTLSGFRLVQPLLSKKKNEY